MNPFTLDNTNGGIGNGILSGQQNALGSSLNSSIYAPFKQPRIKHMLQESTFQPRRPANDGDQAYQ